ncbi:MAG: DUF4139 domain-containing protein, partial [Alphaproteobacteria bacterium]|nr:DUF4139 domain-containing protein [Alphaproteobacteria bacterium]
MNKPTALSAFLGLMLFAPAVHAQTSVPAPVADSQISVYSDGLSVVSEQRSVVLDGTDQMVLLPHLPEGLDMSSLSVAIGNVSAGSVTIRQDTLSPQSLLMRSVGKEISWLVPVGDSGAEREIRGTLINVDGGLILKVGDRYEAMPPNGRLALDSLPEGMTGGLEIVAVPAAGLSGDQPVALRYVTPSLTWSADYTAALNPDQTTLTLSGHYLITNGTDRNYTNATLRLVAGETNRVAPMRKELMVQRAQPTMSMAVAQDSAAGGGPMEATLGDVHVYDVAGTVDLPSTLSVRRSLQDPVTLPVTMKYRLEGNGMVHPGQPSLMEGLRPTVRLSFENTKDGPLSKALPAGPVRVYGALAEDGPTAPSVILGEDYISHLPVGGTAELALGQAFDVTASRKVVSYETTGVGQDRRADPYQATHEITLKNGRKNPVEIELIEGLYGQKWSISDASIKP